MAKPDKFVMVCVNQRPEGHPRGSCANSGGRDIINRFAENMDEKALFGRISLVQTGCLGPCMDGPMVAVMPDNVWYCNVTSDGVDKIVDEHLIGGNPVKDLIFDDRDWG